MIADVPVRWTPENSSEEQRFCAELARAKFGRARAETPDSGKSWTSGLHEAACEQGIPGVTTTNARRFNREGYRAGRQAWLSAYAASRQALLVWQVTVAIASDVA